MRFNFCNIPTRPPSGLSLRLGALVGIFFCLSLGYSSVGYCQHPQPRLIFDAATIRVSAPNEEEGGIKPSPGGDGYIARNVSVKTMIGVMYGISAWQITGGPAWLDSEHYDIQAKTNRTYTIQDLHEMYKNLLTDRFQLKLHKETRTGPAYALMVDKTGPKLKLNVDPGSYSIPLTFGEDERIVATGVSMSYFCIWLSNQLIDDQRPVVDETGLDKKYDFTLPPFAPPSPLKVNGEIVVPPEEMDRPTLFDALKKELGLTLEKKQSLVNYLVIDKLEKPSPN